MEPRNLLDYQKRVARAGRPERGESGEARWGCEAWTLLDAGWDFKVREGVRIWCRDEDDPREMWKSEAVACAVVRSEGEG